MQSHEILSCGNMKYVLHTLLIDWYQNLLYKTKMLLPYLHDPNCDFSYKKLQYKNKKYIFYTYLYRDMKDLMYDQCNDRDLRHMHLQAVSGK